MPGALSAWKSISRDKTTAIAASRGVVLATGQYDSNPRLMNLFDEFNSWPPRGAPRNQGDGLVLAAEHGAALKVMHGTLSILLGYHVKGESVDGQPLMRGAGSREVAYPHCIIVNRAGKRFADESSFGEVAAKLREFHVWSHRPVNVPCYMIFDSQYWGKYGLQPLPPGSQPPEWLDSAATVGALAERLGIASVGLTETVERFNGFAAAGHDEDFQRGRMPWSQQASGDLQQKNANLGSLSQPPYFAIELKPISGHSVGLLTNGNGQVIHLRGHAIAGSLRVRRRRRVVTCWRRLPSGTESWRWNDLWIPGRSTRGTALAFSFIHHEDAKDTKVSEN